MQELAEYPDKSYQIYALVDPRNNAIRYIGASSNIHSRYSAYISGRGSSPIVGQWLKELEEENLTPLPDTAAESP